MECFGVKCGKAHVAAHGTDTIRTQCPLASGERLQGSVVSYSRAGVREYNQTVIHRHSHAEIRFVDFHVITWLRHTRTYMNLRVNAQASQLFSQRVDHPMLTHELVW